MTSEPRPCESARDAMALLVGGDLPAEAAHTTWTHLSTCQGCRQELHALRAARGRLLCLSSDASQSGPGEQFFRHLEQEILELVAATPRQMEPVGEVDRALANRAVSASSWRLAGLVACFCLGMLTWRWIQPRTDHQVSAPTFVVPTESARPGPAQSAVAAQVANLVTAPSWSFHHGLWVDDLDAVGSRSTARNDATVALGYAPRATLSRPERRVRVPSGRTPSMQGLRGREALLAPLSLVDVGGLDLAVQPASRPSDR